MPRPCPAALTRQRGHIHRSADRRHPGRNASPNRPQDYSGLCLAAAQSTSRRRTLESRLPGYVLEIDPGELDAHRFERLVEEGTAAIGSNPGRARELLGEALDLWRGRPYQDLADFETLRPEIVHLEQLHLAAREARVAADIFDGNEANVLPELEDLTRRYPLREGIWTLRMRPLSDGEAGRGPPCVRGSPRTLADVVGLGPGAELRLLDERILDQDPILDTCGALEPVGAETRDARRNPCKGLRPFTEADTDDFYGRRELIRRLLEAL